MKKIADMMSKTGKWLLVFGFIFSQLSFPLEVLADELIENDNLEQSIVVDDDTNDLIMPVDATDTNTDEAVIKVNGEETLDYTIEDNTDVSIVLEYQGEEEQVEFDFSKKLYGIYQYTFESVEKTVTIRYEGNNADLLKAYEVGTDVTKKIVCDMTVCIINGFGNESVKVSDIGGYYNLELFSNEYDATVSIKDLEDNVVDTSVVVVNGYKLEIVDNQTDITLVNTTPISSYTLNRVGDVFVPSDGLIDAKDQKQIVDDILLEADATSMNDLNEDGVLNILDATHSTFIEDIATGEESDILTNTLIVDKTEVLVGEKIKVELLVSGFDKLSLWGIEGLLEYDNNILKLVGAEVYVSNEELENLGYFNLDNNKFAYVLSEGFNNSEIAILTLEFESLAAGNSEITISNILESYGEAFDVTNDIVTENVTVLEDGTGGDTEEDSTIEEDKTEDTVEDSIIEEDKPVVMPVVLSSDYYIKNLSIAGYELDFNMYTYEYSIKVGHNVNSLDFNVLLNDNNAIYYVEGNENFKTGENLVYLVVKAQNGSTKTYTIKVNKEEEQKKEVATEIDEDETEDDSSKNTSKTIIIILIILVIIGLIYVIFKDDEEDKKEVVKEVKSEKSNSSKERQENKKTNNVKKSPKKGNKK